MIDNLTSGNLTTGKFRIRHPFIFALLFCVLLIVDRCYTLFQFGFVYTDIDQTVLWNGVLNYSLGIFHEPFFYGQAYNYMLEAFLAVPLFQAGVPVYIALPIITSFLTLFPFLTLAGFLYHRKHYFYACLVLAFPPLLPVEYNFLTTLPRGFVQAMLFIPLLYPALFQPQNKRSINLLFLGSALCLIANTSSALFVLPILLYVYSFNITSLSFYLKSLIAIPVFALDYLARQFYHNNPERIIHPSPTINLSRETFVESLKLLDHFEYLFPFMPESGIFFPFLFLILAIVSFKKSKSKAGWFNLLIITLLIFTLAIPKVQERHNAVSFFFTPSRLYLSLPLLFIISFFITFGKIKTSAWVLPALVFITTLAVFIKNNDIKSTIAKHMDGNYFPIAENQKLLARAEQLNKVADHHHVNLIVNANISEYRYVFDSYAYNPVMRINPQTDNGTICVNLNGDRRTWLYSFSTPPERILLNGFEIDVSQLQQFEHKMININQILITQNDLPMDMLFKQLGYKFGV